jgi:tyrosyl-tRNA synthetase
LLSFKPIADIESLRAEIADGKNPRDVKFLLAEELVARFHDAAAATMARTEFVARFQQGALPADLPEVAVKAPVEGLGIAHLLKSAGLAASTSEAIRLIDQGAVRLDGERIEDRKLMIPVGSKAVIQVGKRRLARVSVTSV